MNVSVTPSPHKSLLAREGSDTEKVVPCPAGQAREIDFLRYDLPPASMIVKLHLHVLGSLASAIVYDRELRRASAALHLRGKVKLREWLALIVDEYGQFGFVDLQIPLHFAVFGDRGVFSGRWRRGFARPDGRINGLGLVFQEFEEVVTELTVHHHVLTLDTSRIVSLVAFQAVRSTCGFCLPL